MAHKRNALVVDYLTPSTTAESVSPADMGGDEGAAAARTLLLLSGISSPRAPLAESRGIRRQNPGLRVRADTSRRRAPG